MIVLKAKIPRGVPLLVGSDSCFFYVLERDLIGLRCFTLMKPESDQSLAQQKTCLCT